MRTVSLLLFLACAIPSSAFAQEIDLLSEDEDDSPLGDPKPIERDFEEPPDGLEDTLPDPVEGEEGTTPEGEEPTGPGDLLGDDPDANQSLGGDSAETYRKTLERVKGMDPDDEMQIWDEYLRRYPTSSFKPQIAARMEQLENEMYDLNRIRPRDEEPELDPNEAQMAFSQGLQLENINPRRRVQLMFEWGLPDFAGFGADYEHTFKRSFSLHAGLRRRFTGVNVEGGARWAVVKSARTHTFVTLIGDVHLNAIPVAFFGFRPQLAAGKRFGKLDLQGQFGADLSPRAKFDVKLVGGLNATYRASDAVAMFVETSAFMSAVRSGEFGLYRFNSFTFGMKFFPNRKAKDPESMELNVGASLPYSNAYWQYHYGALTGQANFYLE